MGTRRSIPMVEQSGNRDSTSSGVRESNGRVALQELLPDEASQPSI
jgi:hypothetical protein